MWNSMKSVQLSLICTKIVIAFIVVCAVALPFMLERYLAIMVIPMNLTDLHPFMVILYLCCVPAMTALICLHMLLGNIKKEEIFIPKNVNLLRLISWCCFLAALIMMFAFRFYIVFGFVAVAIGFIGLILRVVKNVIEEAMIIKNENDFTI